MQLVFLIIYDILDYLVVGHIFYDVFSIHKCFIYAIKILYGSPLTKVQFTK